MMRVLVVEDEEMIRKGIVLATDWQSLGCVVVGEAANGEEGIAQAEKCRPSLIITDLKMPKMDGLEMIAKLREAGCDAYIIILTAYDSFTYAQTALRLGAVDFLLKPFHDGDLENAVLALQKKLSSRKKEPEAQLPAIRAGAKSRYVQEAMDYIAGNCADPGLSVGQVAASLGLSEGHLSHLFKKETDCTVGSYLTRCRMQKAMTLLKKGKLRGIESNGMMCSIEELGSNRDMYPLAPENGIYILPEDTEVGADAIEVLGLHDVYAVSKVQLAKDYLAQSGVDSADAVFLGDTNHDAEVARAIGCRCCLISGGHQNDEVLSHSGAPVLKSLTELYPLLGLSNAEEEDGQKSCGMS